MLLAESRMPLQTASATIIITIVLSNCKLVLSTMSASCSPLLHAFASTLRAIKPNYARNLTQYAF